MGPGICISNRTQQRLRLLVQGPHSEIHWLKVKGSSSGFRSHLQAVWFQASDFSFLCFSFLIHKMGIITEALPLKHPAQCLVCTKHAILVFFVREWKAAMFPPEWSFHLEGVRA